jgi:hypothetical protein
VALCEARKPILKYWIMLININYTYEMTWLVTFIFVCKCGC